MAQVDRIQSRTVAQPPRAVVILVLAVLTWALFWSAGNAVVASFQYIAGA